MNMKISGENVKRLRLERGWSQEQLAALSGRNVRTIQRVEKSGICDLETRSALAAVFAIDATQLNGTKKIEQAKAPEGDDFLYYSRLTNGNDIVSIFDDSHMYRFSNEAPRSGDDAEYIAWVVSQIHDYSEIWGDVEPGSVLRIRKGSTPEPEHKELYRLLGVSETILRPRKTWTEPTAAR